MISKVTIEFIPAVDQRYRTSADWVYNEVTGEVRILASQTPDWRDSIAVAIHELVEAVLCAHVGVSQQAVDTFDIDWERRKDLGETTAYEPGQDPAAPYHSQHMLATAIELLVTNALERNWDEHNLALDATEEEYNRGK